jgi:hypothetical protein
MNRMTTMKALANSIFGIIAVVALSQRAAQAQITVAYNAGIGLRDVVDSAGVPLAFGNQVRIGFFPGDFDVAANTQNLAALDAGWVPYDSTSIRNINTLGQPQLGRFAVDSATSSDPIFNGQQILLWVFKTSDDGPPQAGFGNVSEYGLYSSTLTNWKFPTQGSDPSASSILIDTSEVNQFIHGTLVDGTPGSLQLAAVPEPMGYGLATGLVLAAFALARFGRRSER